MTPDYKMRAILIAAIAILLSLLPACGPARGDRVVVGSKNFTESLILGEIIAQEIEMKTHLPVERRFYLAGTYICQQALLAGRVDIYPEYTGTALTAVLKEAPVASSNAAFARVQSEYARRFNFAVGPMLGFNDTFAIEIRGADARKLGLKTIAQAAAQAPQWHAGFGYEFMERPDGYKGLAATYGLRFADAPRVMDLGLTTRALASGQVDLIAGNSTDGLIPALDLFVLEDDKHYFASYEAVPVARQETLDRHPELKPVLEALANKITEDDMRKLNYAVDGQHRDAKEVVKDFLQGRGL